MASARVMPPSLLVIPAFSRHPEALAWAEVELTRAYGPVGLRSPDLPFHHTKYYEREMGPGLIKRFLAFERLIDSNCLPIVKNFTNALEVQLAERGHFPDLRPLNLDPGVLQLGKFCLATTKDKDHRIYLSDGIFAEVTLRFEDGAYHPWPWTYADYREPAVLEFLLQAREFYKPRLMAWKNASLPRVSEPPA